MVWVAHRDEIGGGGVDETGKTQRVEGLISGVTIRRGRSWYQVVYWGSSLITRYVPNHFQAKFKFLAQKLIKNLGGRNAGIGKDYIGASLPRLVISLLGGARKEMTLPLEYRHCLKTGLWKASDAADACIITDGTDAGLSTYIGRVMSDRDDTVLEGREGSTGPPLIGISSWAKLMYQKPLADGRTTYKFESLSNTPYAELTEYSEATNELDPNHGVHFLIDDGADPGKSAADYTAALLGDVRPLRHHFGPTLAHLSAPHHVTRAV